MRRGQCRVRYLAGTWDNCERLAAAIPELVTTLGSAELAAEGLAVQVARGRSVAAKRLRDLALLADVDPYLDTQVAVREAELATWQGDLERARSAIQRALAAADAIGEADRALDVAKTSMKALTIEAERANRIRMAGDAEALDHAVAVGHALLERVRAVVEQAHTSGFAYDVHVRGWHAKTEAEWTRLQGPLRPRDQGPADQARARARAAGE